jgi:hypothetical protein
MGRARLRILLGMVIEVGAAAILKGSAAHAAAATPGAVHHSTHLTGPHEPSPVPHSLDASADTPGAVHHDTHLTGPHEPSPVPHRPVATADPARAVDFAPARLRIEVSLLKVGPDITGLRIGPDTALVGGDQKSKNADRRKTREKKKKKQAW